MIHARDLFAGKLVLAPMTRGSNVPFRRLCRELGADVTVGEMAVAKKIVQRRRGELALLRTHPDDHPFGAQLADRNPLTLAQAAARAEEMGSDFVDLNCGCPIDHFVRKGMGARLMQRPKLIGELIGAMRRSVTIPVTVKLRLGWSEKKVNFLEVARVAREEGADAIFLHARTREQRYSRAADWDLIRELKESLEIPVIGNGDLLTHWEVERQWSRSGCDSVMTARGALIKPWIFQEVREKRTIHKDPVERLALNRRYAELAIEHFGDDEHGRERIRDFLAWHLGFFCRYRHLPEETYGSSEDSHPLLQTRHASTPGDNPLVLLLERTDRAAHEHLARVALGEAEVGDAPASPDADQTSDVLTFTSNG